MDRNAGLFQLFRVVVAISKSLHIIEKVRVANLFLNLNKNLNILKKISADFFVVLSLGHYS